MGEIINSSIELSTLPILPTWLVFHCKPSLCSQTWTGLLLLAVLDPEHKTYHSHNASAAKSWP